MRPLAMSRLADGQRYTVFANGEHFPVSEQPVLYTKDLRHSSARSAPERASVPRMAINCFGQCMSP
jgi:hypothetical protein